jgi:hypothetical protein
MVRWVRDTTGRFPQRPHYASSELDQECEVFVTSFLKARHGVVQYPIETDDLTVLLERETEELDLYADLSAEGDDVQGVTDFYPSGRPRVRIARELTEVESRENRLRTTLTHELGHVKFHSFMWAMLGMQLSTENLREVSPRCKRESILNAPTYDWMEWQAAYASGALLMPASRLRQVVEEARQEMDVWGEISARTDVGGRFIKIVQHEFRVSADAARVRLIKRGYMIDRNSAPSLF